jgi:hypothetical protein
VPHKGWTCTDVEDLGSSNMQICEMCETSEIRYAHTMTHPDYKGRLVVGVVCAGHMEQDVQRARDREREVRNRSSRRERWPYSKWRVSRAGHEYRDRGGYRCLVQQWPQGWQLKILPLPDGEWIAGRKRFATVERAKLAGFDYITEHPRRGYEED